MNTNPAIHIVYGPVAAGKSTFAMRLAAERGAVRFALDDWMHALFGPDRPETLTLAWITPRVARCRDLIWQVAAEALANGGTVVAELGLLREAERTAVRGRVEAAGHRCEFHGVDAPRDVRLARLLQRNRERGPTFAFEVAPAMFEAIEAIYEPTSPREADHRRVDTAPVPPHA